ncbi:MAG: glycosyltransferase family 2 protein [Ignavibacteriales bacterium]|nr:glycosyltransferase family 2 protein [Ignavibacteriales bacterium]
MIHPPLVYIIVLTWNGKADTLECLQSLQKLSYSNYKIIVVDNASTDSTAEEVRHLYPSVEVIRNSSNLRFAGGNNIGIKTALNNKADYILLLNNDTIVAENFLSHLVEAAESDERIGMTGPKIYYHSDPKRIWYAGGVIDWWTGSTSHLGVREIDIGQFEKIKTTDYVTGCSMLVKKSVIEQIGVLDESYYIYGEDADWSLRAVRAGFKLLFVPQALVWHKVSVSTGGHFSWFKNWNKLKSQLRFLVRYAKPFHWFTIPFLMPLNILFTIYRSKQNDIQ